MESIYEQINKTRNDVFFPYFFHLDKTSSRGFILRSIRNVLNRTDRLTK